MIVSMDGQVPGREVGEILGIARGNIVRARFVGRDFVAGLRNLVVGEVSEYTKLLEETRDEAFDRMVTDAKKMGADAILTFRFSTSTIMEGTSEILAYGTAVKLK